MYPYSGKTELLSAKGGMFSRGILQNTILDKNFYLQTCTFFF